MPSWNTADEPPGVVTSLLSAEEMAGVSRSAVVLAREILFLNWPERPFLRNRIRLVHMRVISGSGSLDCEEPQAHSFLVVPVHRNSSATIAENCVG